MSPLAIAYVAGLVTGTMFLPVTLLLFRAIGVVTVTMDGGRRRK